MTGRIMKLPPRSAASGRPLRSWKAPPTRSLERPRYVAHAFQRAGSGGFPAARWWHFRDAPTMTSNRFDRVATGRLRRAFTVVELLVAISVMTLIVLVLYGLFDQVQRALRGNVAQVDVLEGGRSATQLMAGDLEQMEAGSLPASTNLYISLTAVPYRQALL